MSYIITAIISGSFGFIICALLSSSTAQVDYDRIRDVRNEAIRTGNGMMQFGMLRALRMLGLEEDYEKPE